MNEKPMLLIDIDGPLNPCAQSNTKLRKGKQYTMYNYRGFQNYQVWLRKEHGRQLLALADVFDLVWATTWEEEANIFVGPKLGLPELPFIPFKKLCPPQPPVAGIHWKTAVINAYAYSRPFAWVDDECTGNDMLYLAQWHPHPWLVKKIDPAVGLVDKDFVELREWVEGGMHGDDDDGE